MLVSGLGLAAWCIYLWIQFGDPLAFVSVQAAPGWYQGSGPHTWFKVVYVGTMVFGPVDVAIRTTAQAIMCLIAVLLLRTGLAPIRLGIRSRIPWWCWRSPFWAPRTSWAPGAMFLSRSRWWPRPAISWQPGAPKWVRVAVLAVLGTGLMVATAFYARGVEVS